MNTDDKIVDFLTRAEARPAPSKLDPYYDLIRGLRQRRWTFQEIATALRDEFGVSVAQSTIHAFMKVRAKKGTVASPPSNLSFAPLKQPRFRVDEV